MTVGEVFVVAVVTLILGGVVLVIGAGPMYAEFRVWYRARKAMGKDHWHEQ
jgi:hypothetical protein